MAETRIDIAQESRLIALLLDRQQATKFRQQFLNFHVHEQALIFVELNLIQRQRLYRYLTSAKVAAIFNELDSADVTSAYFKEMAPKYAAAVISAMYTDNAVDMLETAAAADLSTYLKYIAPKKAATIRKLLHYQAKTAGAIMATEFIKLTGDQTAAAAMQLVKLQARQAEIIYYVYVVDQMDRLTGIVTLRDLLTAPGESSVAQLMTSPAVSVKVDDNQEDVARMISDYNFVALPVIDAAEKLIGVITVDDAIDVIDEESAEDYSGLAGVDIDEQKDNPWQAAFKRLPWLITLLLLGMSTASLVAHYDQMVSEASILAVFISSITGTAGNAGTQSLAVAVRRLADPEADRRSLGKIILTEILTGMMIGLITGLAIMLIVGWWQQNIVLGFVIGLAMFCAIIVANLAGSLIPLLMDKIGVDPAVASGPFISTLSDLTSVLIYFNIAKIFLQFIISD